jgi:hypothetical protein
VLSGIRWREADAFFGLDDVRFADAALRGAADFLPAARFAETAAFPVTFFAMARLSCEMREAS